MRVLDPAAQAALDAGSVKLRDAVWLQVKDRTTGAPVTAGYWSDVGTVALDLVNPATQGIEARTFSGAGQLIAIDPIPLVANLTVQTVDMRFSQVSDADTLVRQYDARQGRVEIYRALFEAGSLAQLAPAYARFVGFIDRIQIDTPAEGGDGGVRVTCVSQIREITRSNPATRSDAHMRNRDPNDTYRRHAATVGSWDIRWGTAK